MDIEHVGPERDRTDLRDARSAVATDEAKERMHAPHARPRQRALEEGGLRCTAHRQGPAISPDAVVVLQDMLGGRLGAALSESRPPVVSEVDHLVLRTFEHHVERRLRSVGTLD